MCIVNTVDQLYSHPMKFCEVNKNLVVSNISHCKSASLNIHIHSRSRLSEGWVAKINGHKSVLH